jgi:hypothetical protein
MSSLQGRRYRSLNRSLLHDEIRHHRKDDRRTVCVHFDPPVDDVSSVFAFDGDDVDGLHSVCFYGDVKSEYGGASNNCIYC